MKNLVLGLVKGYTFEQIYPFVASLRATDYTGDICLFYSDLDASAVNSLREYDVELIPFTMGTVNLGFKRVYIFSLLQRIYHTPLGRLFPLHRFFAGLVNVAASTSKSGEEYLAKCRLAVKSFNVYCVRFPLYYLYLAQNRGRYAKVMLTDVRDVIFQRDPFDFEFGTELCVFMEDDRQKMQDCPSNSLWLKTGFGEDVLREIGHEIPSCSGTTIGGYQAIMQYLELMIDHMLPLKSHPSGMDQGVHNYLLYKQRLKSVRVFQNRLGPVFTLGKTVDLPTAFDDEGFVLNQDGSVAHVLHQYDRHIERGKLKLDARGGAIRLTTA
ncbi:MAG: hypothetical protein H7Z16_19675 [Pyrinomonadaceae bacterium]|nr:hypothetical protein [Pyrinomonadaceae bacterium]